jgi:hypothetical protein
MAITEWFECTISIDGAVAREYDVPENENGRTLPNEVTKYIEAKSGANFSVEFKIKPLYNFNSDLLAWFIKMDGECKAGPCFERSDFSRQLGVGCIKQGQAYGKGDAWVFKKFKFGNLNTTCEFDLPWSHILILTDTQLMRLLKLNERC